MPVSRAETLLRVKDAEAKAKEILAEAEDKRRSLLAAARRDAIQLVQQEEDKLRAQQDASLTKEKAAVGEARQKLLKKGSDEAARLMSSASGNVPKAKAHLKQSFERAVNASA